MIRSIWVSLMIFVVILLAWRFSSFPHADLVYMGLLSIWGIVCFCFVVVATGEMDARELAQAMSDGSINYWHRGWIYPDPVPFRSEEEQ